MNKEGILLILLEYHLHSCNYLLYIITIPYNIKSKLCLIHIIWSSLHTQIYQPILQFVCRFIVQVLVHKTLNACNNERSYCSSTSSFIHNVALQEWVLSVSSSFMPHLKYLNFDMGSSAFCMPTFYILYPTPKHFYALFLAQLPLLYF